MEVDAVASCSFDDELRSSAEEDVDDPEYVEEKAAISQGTSNGTADGNSIRNSQGAIATSSTLTPVLPPSATGSGIIPVVHNVVSSVDLGCKLNLMKIAVQTRNSEYNPKRFHAVVMRIREPRTAALIFRSGKIVVMGARSEAAANLAARKYARIVQKLGFGVKFIGFQIQNMVASCDMKFPIQLEQLYSSHAQFSSYEPELFPGLVYRMLKPRIALLIFVSGKIVLTGAKSRGALTEALDNMCPILKKFRKQ